MAAADEFDYGDATPTRVAGKLAMVLTLAVFGLAIYGTALVDTFFPAPGITLFGGELATQQRLDEEAELWDGTLAKRFEYHRREHSMIRSIVLPRYGFFRFAYLGDVTGGMIAGHDHWLFLERRVRLSSDVSADYLARTGTMPFVALDRRLASNGIDLTIMPIPRKSYIANDALPGAVVAMHEYDDLLIDGIRGNGVRAVDLREVYRGLDPEVVYHKLDSHWTREGALLAAEACADEMGVLQPEGERLGSMKVALAEPNSSIGLQLLRSIQVKPDRVNLDVLELRRPRLIFFGLGAEVNEWYRNPQPDARLALAGTSFSWNGRVAKALAHYSGERVFDGSLQGGDFMRTVANVLEEYRAQGGLEHLVWETQTAPVVVPYWGPTAWFTDALGKTFDTLPPKASHRIAAIPKGWMRLRYGEFADLSDRPRFPAMVAREGAVLHSGDGAAALLVVGEVEGAPARIAVDVGSVQYEHLVSPGPFRVVLPLLADGATDERVILFALKSPGSRLRVDDAAFVHEPASPKAVGLEVAPAGPRLRLTPREPLRFGRRAALVVLTTRDSPGRANIAVRVRTSAGDVVETFEAIQPGGAIAIDLGAHADEEFVEVVIDSGGVPLKVAAASITAAR